ncbi:hypothetical protein PVAND_015072 [Polypedilum vanderplanki]|uniref:Uncharacterized protein n=1 Tax=Polypedilum vanderplanki TaxID=319348 RepID=A0A9J6BBY1_POLVA|nr:hypothetical protein PVAND_015072 [Polypedilum vanderplanki]
MKDGYKNESCRRQLPAAGTACAPAMPAAGKWPVRNSERKIVYSDNINLLSVASENVFCRNEHIVEEQIVSVPVTLKEKLATWSIKYAIPRAAVTDLLHILHNDNESLPLDSRTLLNTPRTLSITLMKPGKFLYIGLEKCLRNIIQQVQNPPDILYIDLFVDGAPIYKDSYENGQIWPILFRVKNLNSAIFPICIFGGSSKPESFNEFLKPFVEEFISIHDDFQVKNSRYKIKINNLILDTPARGAPTDGSESSAFQARIMNNGPVISSTNITSNITCSPISTGLALGNKNIFNLTTSNAYSLHLAADSQDDCDPGLDRCCPPNGFTCGLRYPPPVNAPLASGAQVNYGDFAFQAA